MCNSSLGVWNNTLSVCLFIFIFVLEFFLKKNKINLCYVVVKFELNCNCGLHFIGLLKVLNITSCH
jgi:hypothetical protein